jgi:hypothetical protein
MHKYTLPYFKWWDPLPSLNRLMHLTVQLLKKAVSGQP